MTKRYLIAAQLPRLVVQMTAAHPRAQITRIFLRLIGNRKNIGLKNGNRNVQQFGIALNLLPIDFVVSRIHDKIYHIKRYFAVAVQLLNQLCHQHGILSTGDTDGNFIARLNQVIISNGVGEWIPDFFFIFGDDTALNALIWLKFSAHFVNSL